MFTVARLASQVLHQPRWMIQAAEQLWGYLASTLHDGIKFHKGTPKEGWEEDSSMEVFADASFSPGGEESHGAVVVMLRGSPLLWKSSRQSTVSLSTAEAELNELIEGLMMGESVAAILEELEPYIMKVMSIRLPSGSQHLPCRRRKLADETSPSESSTRQAAVRQRGLAVKAQARRRHAG